MEHVLEALMLVAVFGGIAAAAICLLLDLRRTRRALEAIDLGLVLTAADATLDKAIHERLDSGCVRLLRCDWLLSMTDERMRRRQDLPEEAFFSSSDAVALLDRADRSVLALSYRWLTALHPDPFGSTLAVLRRYLSSDEKLAQCGLFWDFASLPQKGENGEQRTPEEKTAFADGLKVMTNFYASLTGTAIVQLKDIPTRPSYYDGRVTVFDPPAAGASSGSGGDGLEASVRADLGRFGTVVKLSVDPGFLRGDEDSVANVCFASHEQALRCIDALKDEERGAATVYNETAYDRDRNHNVYSGWCTMEQGMAMLATAHLGQAARQAQQRGSQLGSRFAKALESRPKLTDISGGAIVEAGGADDQPAMLREQIFDAIADATFVGKGVKQTVQQMCFEYEWTMKLAMEQAQAADAKSGLTLDRQTSRDVRMAASESVSHGSSGRLSARSLRRGIFQSRVFPSKGEVEAASSGPFAPAPFPKAVHQIADEAEVKVADEAALPELVPQTELHEY